MTGVILSGGKNTRMGENKAFLKVGEERLIDRTVRLFRRVFREVIIVTTSPLDYLDQEATIVTDILPEKGALGGLYTGLFYATDEYAFLAACDMPFLNTGFHGIHGPAGDKDTTSSSRRRPTDSSLSMPFTPVAVCLPSGRISTGTTCRSKDSIRGTRS